MENLDLSKYLDIALRRKYWFIIPFLVSLLGGGYYTLVTPKIYQAETLILVQPQKVPEQYVRSLVDASIEERLKTISQQVTSRTNLEAIIKNHQLYNQAEMILDQKVELFRKRITVNVGKGGRGGNTFTLAFKDSNPKKAADVTNTLASNFISENLTIRESQAIGTSTFLGDELESVRAQLIKKEELLKEYRQKYMGAMPEHLQANLNILGRLQMQMDQLNSNLIAAENRKLLIQKQISEAEMMRKQLTSTGLPNPLIDIESADSAQGKASGELDVMKKQLALLEVRYKENYPDVKRLKNMIAKKEAADSKAEAEAAEQKSDPEKAEAGRMETEPVMPMMDDLLKPQLQQINGEIKDLRDKIQKVLAQTDLYQKRAEDTPQREQELISLTRDYDNLKRLYESMLNRKLESDIALSMEKKQKGEQFRVIDPAKVPDLPKEPDVGKILFLVLILGLGLGAGLAYLMEMMDTSFGTPEGLEKGLQLPVLISMPIRFTDRELKRQRLKEILMAASVSVGFVLSAAGIVLSVKGVEGTLGYIKNLLAKV